MSALGSQIIIQTPHLTVKKEPSKLKKSSPQSQPFYFTIYSSLWFWSEDYGIAKTHVSLTLDEMECWINSCNYFLKLKKNLSHNVNIKKELGFSVDFNFIGWIIYYSLSKNSYSALKYDIENPNLKFLEFCQSYRSQSCRNNVFDDGCAARNLSHGKIHFKDVDVGSMILGWLWFKSKTGELI